MSWQRATETFESEWLVFTKDIGKGLTALLEEANKNLSYRSNWRLSIMRTVQKKVETVEQYRFRIPPGEDAHKHAQKKADDLLDVYAKEVKEAKKAPEPQEEVDDGPGEWVWVNSHPEWKPARKPEPKRSRPPAPRNEDLTATPELPPLRQRQIEVVRQGA